MNTRSKRASSVGLALAFVLAPVFPDGVLDQGDRQHIALSYSGIASLPPVPDVVPDVSTVIVVEAYDRIIEVDAYDRVILVGER